ncbi:MAG: hypothetical protein LBO06_03630 [Bacteroidales bacterium]|jgi:hypothetical protein|nr:hypothetical protein [Bacteroidales bacterium]
MKKIIGLIVVIFCFWGCSTTLQKTSDLSPITIDKKAGTNEVAFVSVCVTAKTSDEQLLEIRKKIIQHTKIRFTNFDVIRGSNGDIYFLSMAIDCRDGYSGEFSHSFEPGDTSVQGFYRHYYKNTYNKPFVFGDISDMPAYEPVKRDTVTPPQE